MPAATYNTSLVSRTARAATPARPRRPDIDDPVPQRRGIEITAQHARRRVHAGAAAAAAAQSRRARRQPSRARARRRRRSAAAVRRAQARAAATARAVCARNPSAGAHHGDDDGRRHQLQDRSTRINVCEAPSTHERVRSSAGSHSVAQPSRRPRRQAARSPASRATGSVPRDPKTHGSAACLRDGACSRSTRCLACRDTGGTPRLCRRT